MITGELLGYGHAGVGGGQNAPYISILLDIKDNRGPEAKLKLLYALLFPPFIFSAFSTVMSQNRHNQFVFCLCSKNLATK